MTQNIITLDAREEFRSGQRPCDKIHDALDRVSEGEALRLLVPFQPVPLLELARSKGLAHEAKPLTDGDWEVLFYHGAGSEGNNANPAEHHEHACGCGCSEVSPAEVVELDARHLEPPQPMVKILELLPTLSAGTTLRARTDRRPIHLYPLLESRGFIGSSEEQPDGSFVTHIRRC